MNRPILSQEDALIIVDVQNDFLPGGNLAVKDGDQVIPVINRMIESAQAGNAEIVVSRDWHPQNHISFQEQGGEWPVHCVQGTQGAEFHPDLQLPENIWLISKGEKMDQDQYSAMKSPDIADQLKEKGIRRVWIGGLAQDVCVLNTVLDFAKAGFEVHVVKEATKPVYDDEGSIQKMLDAGAIIESGVFNE